MEYEQAVEYLYSMGFFKIKLGLTRIKKLLKELGSPEKELKIIHVAGTNGKGSVCEMVNSILTAAGYKVGMYTSPHLERFTERIRIGEKEISKKDVVRLAKRLRPVFDKVKPTFFEAVTAMALVYFKEQDVDFLVLEVGLGGRLDATNACNGMINIITNISKEHTKHLGTTIKSIAHEKAGIIKKNKVVITGAKGIALQEIKEVAKKNNAMLIIPCPMNHYILGLKGNFQKENAKIAVECIKELQKKHKISDKAIKNGLKNAFWPGRMEKIDNILLDCAHNPAGIKVLVDELRRIRHNQLVLVFGVSNDKDYRHMISPLVMLADKIILTKADNDRGLSPMVLDKAVAKGHFIAEKIEDAIKHAKKQAKKGDLILITGSIYVVGEARSIINSH